MVAGMGNAVCPTHGLFKPTQEGCCPKCWAEHDWSKPNDRVKTRSGSFGPAAELAAAHMEIERLKAWSNEQIAKLTAEATYWREAWAKAQVQADVKAPPLGSITDDEWKELDPER